MDTFLFTPRTTPSTVSILHKVGSTSACSHRSAVPLNFPGRPLRPSLPADPHPERLSSPRNDYRFLQLAQHELELRPAEVERRPVRFATTWRGPPETWLSDVLALKKCLSTTQRKLGSRWICRATTP
jgi:hypothetical protein